MRDKNSELGNFLWDNGICIRMVRNNVSIE